MRFNKFQATGNDFVIIDNRDGKNSLTKEEVVRLCDRKFGVGADGLMLIEKDSSSDFNLVYYNADGSASLCGNGSRAAVVMASRLGIINGKTKFNAYDGLHEADILSNGQVRLKMNKVQEVKKAGEDLFINTGSPHLIRFVKDAKSYPVFEEGKKIRYSEEFKPGGTNANFVELLSDNTIYVRTYERGVENETLSCGTGVTASALAASFRGYSSPVNIKTLGGDLQVEFKASQPGSFDEIYLIGPAKMVFEGSLEL
jgi:diaminopimelate epimerase